MDYSNDSDKARFLASFKALTELHRVSVSPELTKLYFMALQDFPVEAVVKAMGECVMTCTFFPKPVEIREKVTGSADDRAQVQAATVWESIGRVGSYNSVAFDDPVTMAVIDRSFGGWTEVCQLKESERKWFIIEFCKAYKAFAAQGIQHFGVLAGRTDTHNGAHCFGAKAAPVALVGDKHMTKQIALQGERNEPLFTLGSLEQFRALPQHDDEVARQRALRDAKALAAV